MITIDGRQVLTAVVEGITDYNYARGETVVRVPVTAGDHFLRASFPELATLDDTARKHTLIALEALTDFESWARMRELYGLSVEQGCALWIRIIDRILPPTPAR